MGYVDDEGYEVVAMIPKGRTEEYLEAVARGDVEKLKGLNGVKRRVV